VGEDKYKAYLKDLTEWNEGNHVVIGKIHNKLFEHALYVVTCTSVSSVLKYHHSHSAGALNIETTSCVSNDTKLCAQQELEGQTGDTDSEVDAE
jgi:hypothetical protein